MGRGRHPQTRLLCGFCADLARETGPPVGPQLPVPLPCILSLVPLLISWKLDLWSFATNSAPCLFFPSLNPFFAAHLLFRSQPNHSSYLHTPLPANTPLIGGLSHR